MCCVAPGTQVDGLEGGLAEDEVEERGIVRLHNEEEDFFKGDVKQLRAHNDVSRIAPDAVADEVRIPGDCCDDGDLVVSEMASWRVPWRAYRYQERDLVDIELGEERAVQQGEQHSRRDVVLEVAVTSCQFGRLAAALVTYTSA